jgi:hypothetical protein
MQPLLLRKSSITQPVCVFVAHTASTVRTPYGYLQPAQFYMFPYYLITGTDFEKKVIEHKMCVSSYSTTFARNIIYSKN